jgi:hypothetical protein
MLRLIKIIFSVDFVNFIPLTLKKHHVAWKGEVTVLRLKINLISTQYIRIGRGAVNL